MYRNEEIVFTQCKRYLSEFLRHAWHVVEPSTPLIWNWHLDVMCDHVQALVEGRMGGKRNLIINVPPGSAKSTILSVCLPAWMWVQDPSWRGLFASGNESIAIRDSIKCRNILESEWYQTLFRPKWTLARDQNAKGHYNNSAMGFRQAMSAGSGITGSRASAIYVDDPNDADKANSKAERDSIIQWWNDAAYNRLSDMKTGHRIIIQQRLHEEDLTGHILATDAQDWAVLVIRQEYERPGPNDPDFCPTPIEDPEYPGGWTDPRTTEGDLFFPTRFPAHVLEAEKRVKGLAGYAGQHQQRPVPKEGAIFKRGYVQFYDPSLPLPPFKRKIMSWDTAYKEKQQNDPSCGLVAGEAANGIYLLDHRLARLSYPDLKAAAQTWAAKHNPSAVLIEDKASGQSLIQDFRRDTGLPVVAVKVDSDKVSRAWVAVPTWEAGLIYVPTGAEWVDAFLEEIYAFPRAAHDDQVDTFTQLINYIYSGADAWAQLIDSDLEERRRARESNV